MSTPVLPAGPKAKDGKAPAEQRARFESTYACILAYNDETGIAKVVRLALSHCGNVIVCDDGSTDGTSGEARKAGAHVIRHETRLGKGSSMSDLVNEVILRSPSGFVLLEREGFAHADDIPAVLEPIIRDQADVAVGMTGTGGAAAVDAGITAMNSKGLFKLYREFFFSDVGTSPQTAIAAAAGLRVIAVSLGNVGARPAAPMDSGQSSSKPPSGRRRMPRFNIFERDFLTMGIPAIAFTVAGIWLLAGFLIAYNYTGKIPVPQGVKGVIGLASLIFGMAFMVSYNVVYSVKNAAEGKKE